MNFHKKCGEMWRSICFHSHSPQFLSKNSPHSQHFLQKVTQKSRPGKSGPQFLGRSFPNQDLASTNHIRPTFDMNGLFRISIGLNRILVPQTLAILP